MVHRPALDRLTFLMEANATSEYAAYLNGERDEAIVPESLVAGAIGDPELSRELRPASELSTYWININNTKPPFNNVLVRRAISEAIDREALVRDAASGAGRPATSLIPPGMPGFEPQAALDRTFDRVAARALLGEAGYPDPAPFPRLSFTYQSISSEQRRAEFVQEQLKQNLGIDIVLNPLETKAYQAAFKNKNFELGSGAWVADYPDPQDWFNTLFGCAGGTNKFNYCNPVFDQAVADADRSTDKDTRLARYSEAQSILIQDMCNLHQKPGRAHLSLKITDGACADP